MHNNANSVLNKLINHLDHPIELAILCLAFALPLSVDIASIILVIGSFLWIIKMILARKLLWRKTPLDILVILFVAISGISIYVSPDRAFSLYNYFYLMGSYILTYYLIINNVESLSKLKRLFVIFLFSSTLAVSYGFYQNIQGIDISTFGWIDKNEFPEISTRVFSTFGNPNLFAGFLVIIMCFFSGLCLYEKGYKLKLFFFMLFFVTGICLLLTYSRGLWISFLAALFIQIIFSRGKALLMLASIPLFALLANSTIWERLLSVLNPVDSSATLRIAIWESTLSMISQNPLLGIGWGAYWLVYPKYDYFLNDPSIIIYHAHNTYLHIAAEIGLIGLMVFLVLFFAYMVKSYLVFTSTKDSWLKGIMLGVLSALFALFISGFTDHILFSMQISMIFWFINAIVITASNLKDNNISSPFIFTSAKKF